MIYIVMYCYDIYCYVWITNWMEQVTKLITIESESGDKINYLRDLQKCFHL